MSQIIKLNARTFYNKFKREETENHSTYRAIELFFDYLQTKSSITSIVIKNHEFLVDSGRKKAVSLNFVTWKWKPKRNGERPGDFMSRCVTADSYHIIVKDFFSRYGDYTLALDICSRDHDSMLFIQRLRDGGHGRPSYSYIHYNPKIGGELTVATYFVQKMSANFNIFGYHTAGGNPNAECTPLTWTEAFKFIRLSLNPFSDQRIKLWPFNKKNRRWTYTPLKDLIPDTVKDDAD